MAQAGKRDVPVVARAVALDLKAPEGQEILRKLLQDADILIENFRPGTMGKRGWDGRSYRN